ncbi:MAG: hypothetical protein ABI239_08860 [Aquihabitans sp.]
MNWAVERHVGSATTFHGRAMPDPVRRAVWWFEVDRPAVALGSTQKPEVIDSDRAEAAGVEVVRRRSGGGAVWLAPGVVTWVDVLLPADDPLWHDDVSRSARWLGHRWVEALGDLGIEGLVVHDGPMVRSVHSDLICFAGMAPGEVTLDGAKAVGISQRRTRRGARFQCAVLHEWNPQPLADLLAMAPVDRHRMVSEVAAAGVGIGAVPPSAVVAALMARLRSG